MKPDAGAKAILLTVDAPFLGRRYNEYRNKFDLPKELRYPHLENLDKSLTDSYGKHEQGIYGSVSKQSHHPNNHIFPERTFGWAEALGYVRKHCDLPVWVKGVYTPEDVSLAISHGANGVIISNHGGRQLDSVPATLDALRICAPAAKGRIPIAVDGGIRRGTDVFKAIALGADFCFAGRLPIWGLAVSKILPRSLS